jgi:hypothetical protein
VSACVEKLHRVHYSAPDQGLKTTFCGVLALFWTSDRPDNDFFNRLVCSQKFKSKILHRIGLLSARHPFPSFSYGGSQHNMYGYRINLRILV